MAQFRKRPVVIEAVQLTETTVIHTLEGDMTGNPGDWLITGVKGERYPCKDDIFRATYEPAENDSREADVALAQAVRKWVNEQGDVDVLIADLRAHALNPDDWTVGLCAAVGDALAAEAQPCGHPASAIVSTDEDTMRCSECAHAVQEDNDA